MASRWRSYVAIGLASLVGCSDVTHPLIVPTTYPPAADLLQLFDAEHKLTPSDGAEFDEFGISVAINGNWALIGARADDDNGPASGSAYVFEASGTGWNEVAKLTASDGAAIDLFGDAVAISGGLALVGALGADGNAASSGSAYVFDAAAGWSQVAKLSASDGAGADQFGDAVAISGGLALVGAQLDDDNGDLSGSAYVFDRSAGWSQVAKLTASDAAAGDRFGYSVALSGDLAVVGARLDEVSGINTGSAYVFERSGTGWSQVAKLTASDAAAGDNFGSSVAISGDLVVVGAPQTFRSAGSAYVFDGSAGWSELAKLTASDGAANDQFGRSVGISGEMAVVGAYADDDNGSASGSAYVFDGSNGWSQLAKLTASDGTAGDEFGFSVAISDDHALVGAHEADGNAASSGSAYLFETPTPVVVLEDMIDQIEVLVADGELNEGQGNALMTKLDQALTKIDEGKPKVAINLLNAFINQVTDYIATGVLTPEQGEALIEQAEFVIEQLSE